jgi:hypothetical protein
MKWPDALLKPTREYSGGILAGLGMGVLVAEMIARRSGNNIHWPESLVVGFILIGVGSTLARSGQQLNNKKQRKANKKNAV